MINKFKEEEKIENGMSLLKINDKMNIIDKERKIVEQNIGVLPIDSFIKDVYSETIICPFSFYDYNKPFDKNYPPPTYISYSQYSIVKPTKKEDILNGLIPRKEGGLICVDKEILDRQKGVVKDVSKQLLGKAFGQGGMVSISLPVRIFEPRSVLDRIIDLFAFAPHYLNKAAGIDDHFERFKLVITFSISGLYGSVKQLKPFNPILGETYQGYFPDGTEIYCEHTSHHPPISNFQIIGPNHHYELWGFHAIVGEVSGNTVKAQQKGPNYIKFKDGHYIKYEMAKTKLGGMLFGQRTMLISGHMIFEDLTNNLKAVVLFSPHKKGFFSKAAGQEDDFIGLIYKKEQTTKKQPTKIEKLDELVDVETKLCSISGNWLSHLNFNDKTYWKIDDIAPVRHIPVKNPLPTDCRFREDLIWLYKNNMDYAQKWKVKLEEQQREDRKFRLKKLEHKK